MPQPYDASGALCVSYNPDTDKVTEDFWYWKKLMRYIIDAEAALDIAEAQIQALTSE